MIDRSYNGMDLYIKEEEDKIGDDYVINLFDIVTFTKQQLKINNLIKDNVGILTNANEDFLKYDAYIDPKGNIYLKDDINDLVKFKKILKTVKALRPFKDNITINKPIYYHQFKTFINTGLIGTKLNLDSVAIEVVKDMLKTVLVTNNEEIDLIYNDLLSPARPIIMEEEWYNADYIPYLIEEKYDMFTDPYSDIFNQVEMQLHSKIYKGLMDVIDLKYSYEIECLDGSNFKLIKYKPYSSLRYKLIKEGLYVKEGV